MSTKLIYGQVGLNNIRRAPGSHQQRIRVGRGEGSRKGRTAGRGQKGQRSRTGGPRSMPGFEGGQTPFWRKVPKFGFSNRAFKEEYIIINLDTIQKKIDDKLLDPTKKINMRDLWVSGIDMRIRHAGIKVLGDGKLKQPIDIEVSRASKQAIEEIEKLGGSIETSYYTQLGLRALLRPWKFEILPRRPRPQDAKTLEYYTSEENRGYLSVSKQMKKLGLEYRPWNFSEE